MNKPTKQKPTINTDVYFSDVYPLNGGGMLECSFNAEKRLLIKRIQQMLQIMRGLTDADIVNRLQSDTSLLAKVGVKPEQAKIICTTEYNNFVEQTFLDALAISLMDENFEAVHEDGSIKITFKPTVANVDLSQQYWDQNAQNENRLVNLLPPLPEKNPLNPYEQKLGLIMTLLEMEIGASQIVFARFNAIIAEVKRVLEEEAQLRVQAGFQPRAMDRPVDSNPKPKREKLVRRKRTPLQGVSNNG
jgi:hypothetical protein